MSIVAAFGCVFLVGCENAKSGQSDVEQAIAQYANLPGARQSHNPELLAEIARLQSERATPLLLATRDRDVGVGAPTGRFPGNRELESIFPDNELRVLESTLDRVYPSGRFQFDARQLERAIAVVNSHRSQLARFQTLAKQENLVFEWDVTKGITAEFGFLDPARAGTRLLLLDSGRLIEHAELPAAIDLITSAFHFCRAVAEVAHVVPRVAAVHTRQEILEVVRAIATHPGVDRDSLQRLETLVDLEIAALPPDERAWFGDRAVGLHLYEMIRDGHLLSMLTYKELQQFRDEIGIQRLGSLVTDQIDQDQVFYLDTMRELITACQSPYYQRREQLESLTRELELRRNSANYPFVADYFLLGDVSAGHRLLALDRARLTAWHLALKAASGREQSGSPTVINVLTGFPYVIDIRRDRILVDAIDPEKLEPPIELRRHTSRDTSESPTTSRPPTVRSTHFAG